MQFIIIDLEWNNTYSRKQQGFFNEIIEIGAVKLNTSLEQTGTFSQVIRSQVGKKLRSSVKKLTNISNDEMRSGELFTKTFSHFRKWVGEDETVFFTWGDSDIRVLYENYRYLNGINTIPFLTDYCDLQACYHKVCNVNTGMQAGLSTAALNVGLDPDAYAHHRALDDSLLTADIFRRIYNPDIFKTFYKKCDSEFYNRLFFKAKVITNIDSPLVDKSLFCCTCEKCGVKCVETTKFKFRGQYFRGCFKCPQCGTDYNVGVRFKKYFDRVDIKKVVSVCKPEPEKKDNAELSETDNGGE